MLTRSALKPTASDSLCYNACFHQAEQLTGGNPRVVVGFDHDGGNVITRRHTLQLLNSEIVRVVVSQLSKGATEFRAGARTTTAERELNGHRLSAFPGANGMPAIRQHATRCDTMQAQMA